MVKTSIKIQYRNHKNAKMLFCNSPMAMFEVFEKRHTVLDKIEITVRNAKKKWKNDGKRVIRTRKKYIWKKLRYCCVTVPKR